MPFLTNVFSILSAREILDKPGKDYRQFDLTLSVKGFFAGI